MNLEDLKKQWEDISHGPCFPLKVTDRFGSNRIDDVHGNVVIEQPDIWLPEAAEYLVRAGNVLPLLIEVAIRAQELAENLDKILKMTKQDLVITVAGNEMRWDATGELHDALKALESAP